MKFYRGEWYHGELLFPGSDNVNPYALAYKTFSKSTKSQSIKFHKADYIATLTYQNKTILISVELPQEIRSHNIRIDSNSEYITKIIWPKLAGKGMTGLYVKSRNSDLNFQINGQNLSKN